MSIKDNVYALDFFDDADSTALESHIPVIGTSWVKNTGGASLLIQGNDLVIPIGITTQYRMFFPALGSLRYIEKEIVFSAASANFTIEFGTAGWIARWNPGAGQVSIYPENGLSAPFSATLTPQPPGIFNIRAVGHEDTFTVFFNGMGVRISGIPETISSVGMRVYSSIGFRRTLGATEVKILSVYGTTLMEPDFQLLFNTNFGAVGAFSGSSGGGGGTGGIPNPGASNPGNVPCDPNTTLIINNGAAVSVAPTDPCMWTGQIWWKLVCEAVLTEADYAVEAEVFFNTLTDSFMSVGVIARLDEATGGHYFAALWRSEIVIGKKPSSAADDIIFATKPLTLKAGTWYTIRLEIEGFTLRAYLNDELQLTAVDPNTSFGEPGCAGVRLSRGNPATDIRIDNFRVWLNVKRPEFTETPVFLDGISVIKDDGENTEVGIVVADSLVASETITMLVPKTVHINEGVVFTDKAGQVKRIQEFLFGLDGMNLGIGISVQDVLMAAEKLGLGMNIPVTDVIAFTDEERTIHGVHDTMTVQEFIAQFAFDNVADGLGARDTIRITKTSVAEFAPPELTFYARDLRRIKIVEKGKKVR